MIKTLKERCFVKQALGVGQWLGQIHLRLALLLFLGSLLLSGCVQYDVGVNFDSPNHGEIVQHIKLGEQLLSFSGNQAEAWLDSIQRRARKLQGKARRLSNQEMTVKIPFNNGGDLETKFNEFFHSNGQKKPAATTGGNELPNIDAHFSLNQNNFLLLLRNRLSYDLDLRSLSLISANSNLLISPEEILELEFSLNTPWGARSVESGEALQPESYQGKQQLVWKLKPGQLNHIEAVFWLPSPLGIGTVLIALFVGLGIYLRYRFMPDPTVESPRPTIPESP
ncbi:MAG: DUF3153 domain-containing protein [Chroococcidiopsidaceae cyanobacterium CP_BM_RX_35]|nr:DUF3153 domain-containing protein [Chroococcidiopsidaceae cyanobacterium CP_BM_RX_35]